MSDTSTQLRLPVATLPTPVLPGVTVTLGLDESQISQAITAAAGNRVVFRVPRSDAGDTRHGEVVVVAHVPTTGSLPGGARAAVVQVESRARLAAVHTSERGAPYADIELITDP